jgi:hypothetical protein
VGPTSHVHVHAPHELTEPGEPVEQGVSRRERILELCAVLLLSVSTLATAWSGYQAARWSGEQSQHYAMASTARIHSQQQSTRAGQLRIDDVLNFNGWLDAVHAGDTRLARVYEQRFRPEFLPAFRAWRAQSTVPGPTYMPQYRPVELTRAAAYDRTADRLFTEGSDTKTNDDHYILSTVFFAAVLFFSGISLRLAWAPLRAVVLALGGLLLVSGITYVVTLPVV